MILGPCPLPQALFNRLTQRMHALMRKAHNHPFCLMSTRWHRTTEKGTSTRLWNGCTSRLGHPQPLTREAVTLALKRYTTAASLDKDTVTFLSVRHLGVELCFDANGGVRETQKLLDH